MMGVLSSLLNSTCQFRPSLTSDLRSARICHADLVRDVVNRSFEWQGKNLMELPPFSAAIPANSSDRGKRPTELLDSVRGARRIRDCRW